MTPLDLEPGEKGQESKKAKLVRPLVGIGCIAIWEGQILLVRSRNGCWSTPGGHLDFGESPGDAAIRETLEETGVQVHNVEFVAITNDMISSTGKHYVTIWLRADVADPAISIRDTNEIVEARWFEPNDLPVPRHIYFENLINGLTLPPSPANLPQLRVRTSSSTPRAK
jgi:8-oxo-dGTP diphosphatase